MGSSLRSMMFVSVATILFLVAMYVGYDLFMTVNDSLDATEKTTQNLDPNVQSTLKTEGPYQVTGSEVLQTLYQLKYVGCPVVVDGVRFAAPDSDPQADQDLYYSFNIDSLDQNAIQQIHTSTLYTPRYVRDVTGILIEIDYSSR